MLILFDDFGKILSFGEDSCCLGQPFIGDLPLDFLETFSLGKYHADMVDGMVVIHKDPDWVAPIQDLKILGI